MSITISITSEVMLRPEQLLALENMRSYGVPEDIIEKTKLDFENANYEMLATTSRRSSSDFRKIDVSDYVRSSLPRVGDRQDLAKSLELITAFSLVIDAEVVDKAKKLIDLDELNQYDVLDCVRAIYAVVDSKRGWGDRDNKTKMFPDGRLTMLIQTLVPEETIEYELEEVITLDDAELLPLPEDNSEVITERKP